jgi:quercetin dioxygenase-like cupin family protein
MADQVVVRKPGQGTALWMLGGLYEVKAAGRETNGALTVMEMTLPEGAGPPPHTHEGAEAVYVLDGRIRYHIEDQEVEGGAGTFFYIPEGTWENFEPLEESRLLVVYAPGGLDEFFGEVAEPAERRAVPPPPEGPPDFEKLQAAGAKHGLKLRQPETV